MTEYEYVAVFDDAYVREPLPGPVRLLRTSTVGGRRHEETWVRPGRWQESTFLDDLALGHGDGDPRPVTEEEFLHWQQDFTTFWQSRAGKGC